MELKMQPAEALIASLKCEERRGIFARKIVFDLARGPAEPAHPGLRG
jgi:hypothetical protein